MAGTIHTIEDQKLLKTIRENVSNAILELCEIADLKTGQIVVIGCSTSETLGEAMGSWSVPEVGEAIYLAMRDALEPKGIFVAAQCCEHLNRAIVVEQAAVLGQEIVNVIPQPKAGGSFATAAYKYMTHPVVVEEIKADAGLDIGGTLIGMHLKRVAVPVKLKNNKVGSANVTAARVRPKYIGGIRAAYDESLA